ncbi:hypothetical protein AOQ84DRAFT_188382 [Glonium stellatum]|uniref:Uncharacterized protein n=1 Tax=Glonium stellatum TaxID=574774 RepID=A0A8E2F6H6_9PEZI|nr:hypothetical protein AOQ84DRAFT_188382 [Glonium stellatum]
MCRYIIYTFEACGHQEAIGTQDCGASTSHTYTTDNLGDPGYSCTLCKNSCTFTNKRQGSLDAQTETSGTQSSEIEWSDSSGGYTGSRRRTSSDASLSGASDSDSISSITLSALRLEARGRIQPTNRHLVSESFRSYANSEADRVSYYENNHGPAWSLDAPTRSPLQRPRSTVHSVPSSGLGEFDPGHISGYIYVNEVDAPKLKKWIMRRLDTL